MASKIERPYYRGSDGKPLLWYCLYGEFPEVLELQTASLVIGGFPEGITAQRFCRKDHPEAFGTFFSGSIGVRLEGRSSLGPKVRAAPHLLVIHGEIEDQPTLDFLAQTIDVVSAIAAVHGVGILDPQTLTWWSVDRWKEQFSPFSNRPRDHVEIFKDADQENGFWLHTRGMRKFGRSDLGLYRVPQTDEGLAVEIIERFIDWQALGGVVADGQELRVPGAPSPLICQRVGSLNDEDYNNVHIAILWPEASGRTGNL